MRLFVWSFISGVFLGLLFVTPKALPWTEDKSVPTENQAPLEFRRIKIPQFEQITSVPGTPSLATEDAGTPGPGGEEYSLGTGCETTPDGRVCETGIDAIIGIGENAQFRISKARAREWNEHGSFGVTSGTEVGIKFRFFERNGLKLAVAPSYRFDDGTVVTLRDGSSVPTEGRSVYLPLIISKDLTEGRSNYTVIANVGYRKNLDHDDQNSILTAVALERDIPGNARIMGEVVTECLSFMRDCDREVRVGWIKVIYPARTGRYQTSVYTTVGLGRDGEGRSRRTIQVGLKIQRSPGRAP